jgi:hypothetical protein
MTLEPRMLAVEERLQHLASEMPAPDAEAGWAALSAKLEPQLAQVIPLRRKSFGRPVALAAAAALMVAGSALAAVTHGDSDPSRVSPAATVELPGVAFSGPHLHSPFSGPATAPDGSSGQGSGSDSSTGSIPGGDSTIPGGDSTGTGGSGGGTTDHTKPQDDPNDRDQGTGNDGQHDDQGGGNDGPEGSQPRTGNGNGRGH